MVISSCLPFMSWTSFNTLETSSFFIFFSSGVAYKKVYIILYKEVHVHVQYIARWLPCNALRIITAHNFVDNWHKYIKNMAAFSLWLTHQGDVNFL